MSREASPPRPLTDVEEQVAGWAPQPPMAAPPVAPADDDPLMTWATRLPRSYPPRLKQAAATHRRKLQEIVQEALDEWFDRHDS